MNFVNRVWRVGTLGLVVGLLAAACADDQGAAPAGPPVVVTGSISGTVTAVGTNAPIVGALVGTTPATSTALTDASGNYSIANIPIPASGSASFAVTASHADFTTGAAGTRTVTLTTAAPNATGANLQLTPPAGPPPPITTGNLNVLVTNSAGVPQSGATVTATRQGAAALPAVTTDANGFAIFTGVTAGAYTVTATKTISGIPFRASGGVNVVAGATAFLQLTLARDFGQTVFPNFRGTQTTPTDIDFIPVAGAKDTNPDIDCNIILTQHMFVVRVINAAGQAVSGVKVGWDLNISENGTISTRCPDLTDDPAGCVLPTIPGNTGTIVDSDDPDLNPFTARSGLSPAFKLDSRSAVTFTNDQTGPNNTVQFGATTVTVGEGQTWIIITSPQEGVTDVIASSSDIGVTDPACGLSAATSTPCDKDFAIKRWVNWDIRVFELGGFDTPNETRDPHDSPGGGTFTSISNGSTFTNILSRGVGADCVGGICTLIGDNHKFISEVRRLRPDGPFNVSRGRMVWEVTDDVPDVDFFGEDVANDGDGCDNGVCNVEHNGPSDDQFKVTNAPVTSLLQAFGGSVGNRNAAIGEFDANNNVFDGGVFTQNPDCTAPCDEDDFIGWMVVEVRLDPAIFFCTDVDLDGDCNPSQSGGDTFSPAYQNLINATADNTAGFQIRFVDEFGEVCAVFTFKKRFITSRITVIKNFPGFDRRTIEGFPNIKAHTVLVGETFSYTITAINDGEINAQHVRITDTLPRFGDQFSGPPDLGAPTERNGDQAFQYVNDRPAFDPQAIVYGVDEDDDGAGNTVDFCIIGRQSGNANAAAYVPPAICPAVPPSIEAGTVEAARAAAISSSNEAVGDQIVFIQYYDELLLARTATGGGIQSEDSVEITLRATPALYTRGLTPPATRVPGTWCNIATVTDGPANRGNNGADITVPVSGPVPQSFDADTLCHEVREALLDIRKTATDAVVTAGANMQWTVEVANLGSANLTNVVVRDTIDPLAFLPGRKLQSGDIALNATNCAGCTVTINADSFTFAVTIPTLTPGGFRPIYTLTIPGTTNPGTFCNRVTARASRPSGDLVETDISCITVLPGAVEFDVTNEDGFRDAGGVFQSSKEIFNVGDGGTGKENEMIFQVIITNRSTVFTATNVRVVDLVAPNSSIFVWRATITGFPTLGTVSGTSSAGFTWTIGTMTPGQSAEIQFRAEALFPGNDFNRVTLTADQISGARVDEEPTTVQ